MRDPVAVIAPAIDVAAIGKRVRLAHVALLDAERTEERTAQQAAAAREEAARRRLEIGRALVEARKAWPARGPKAKGWGAFLADAGIDQDAALRWMALAGYVEEKVSRTGEDVREIPTVREVQAANKPAPLPAAAPVEEEDDADEEDEAPVAARPARAASEEEREAEREEEQRRHIARIQPPKMETREERTRRLSLAWGRALIMIHDAREAGLHLTDCTTSPEDFESAKKTIIGVARAALDELEAAGALDAPEPRKRQLSILDGGKP